MSAKTKKKGGRNKKIEEKYLYFNQFKMLSFFRNKKEEILPKRESGDLCPKY